MLDSWPQNKFNPQQDSNTTPLFLYEEIWLKDLVPIPTNTAPITLRLSLSELASPVKTHCTQPKRRSKKTTHGHVTNHLAVTSPASVTCPYYANNYMQDPTRQTPSPSQAPNSTPDISLKVLDIVRSSLNGIPRGRPRKKFQVEFTEHVFSKLVNGKVKIQELSKVKNQLIGKRLKNWKKNIVN